MSSLFHDPLKLLPPATVIFLLLLLSWQFWRRYRRPAGKLAAELKVCTDRLAQVRNVAPMTRRSAAGDVFESSSFAHHWSEFQETLHDQYADRDGERTLERTRATASASHFFSAQSVVDTPLHTEYFRHLPGILTGLGIIGTFFGLMVGLSGFDPAAPEKVQESVSALLHDVLYAFSGSLFSIVCAMLITHVEKKWLRICYTELEMLTDAVDRLFDAGVGEEYLAELVRTSQESSVQTRMLKDSLVTDLREMLQNLVESQVRESMKLAETLSGSYRESGNLMASNISNSIESSLREPLEKIASSVSMASGDQSKMVGSMLQEVLVAFMAKLEGTFGQQFQGLSSMLEQSVRSIQEMQTGFATLVDDLRSASESSSEAIGQQLARTLQDMHSSQEVMQSSLNRMVETLESAVENMGSKGVEAGSNIAAQLERMYVDGEARQQKMADQMDGFVQQLQESVGRGQTETIDKIAGTVAQLDVQMHTMIDGIGQSISQAQEHSLRSVSDASGALTERIEKMFSTLDKGRQDMDQEAQSALHRFQEQASSVLSELGKQVRTLVEVVERERHAMRQTVDTLGSQTERNLQGMQLGADKMRTAAERFDAAGVSVHSALQSSNEMIVALRASSADVAGTSRDLASVVADFRISRDATVQSITTLQSIIASAQQEAGMREKTVNDLMRLSEQIQRLNGETNAYLDQVSSVIGRSFDEFGHGVERTLQKTMGSLDAELDKAVKSLAGGVESVAENIDYLSDLLNKPTPRAVRG